VAGGTYSIASLPYFSYNFEVRAYHHRKATRAVTVNSGSSTEDFALETTQGDLLVINDDDGVKGEGSKVTGYEKDGAPLMVSNTTAGSKAGESATQLGAMLAELGYSVTQETSAGTDPGTWGGYDAVVWSDGLDTGPLSVAGYRTSLRGYVNGGGKLLIEGGEVGYDHYSSDTAFTHQVLHCGTWNTDNAGALSLKQAGHPVATTPNGLPAGLTIAYTGYGDEDAMVPLGTAVAVYGTASYAADAGIMAYDDDLDPTNGQVVYYAFNFRALSDSVTRSQLLENTIEYLLKPSAAPTSSLSGTATLNGQSNHSGTVVKITLGPVVKYDTTDAAGNYGFPGLYAGSYFVRASHTGYYDDTATVAVSGATTADFELYLPSSTLSGTVRLSGQSSHGGVVVTAVKGDTVLCDTTDAAGAYGMIVYDGTYRVTAAKDGYVDTAGTTRTVTVAGSATADFILYPATILYQNDFEANNGGLTGTGDWQYGVPTAGPGAAHSGTKLWATGLATGNYLDNSNSTLTMAALKDGRALPAGAKLEFWMWFDSEFRYDGGNVKVSTDGGSTWAVINPIPGQKYDTIAATTNAGIPSQRCYSGSTRKAWAKSVFDLSAYAGQTATLRLHFGSDGSVHGYAGWYVDDIKVYTVDLTGVAGAPAGTAGLPQAYGLGQAYPNPMRGSVSIAYQLPSGNRVELAVYNIAGQKVRTLASGSKPAGYHTARWDGRDGTGRPVAAGVYLYRLQAGDYSRTGKLSLVR
jgi:hypothetical protein